MQHAPKLAGSEPDLRSISQLVTGRRVHYAAGGGTGATELALLRGYPMDPIHAGPWREMLKCCWSRHPDIDGSNQQLVVWPGLHALCAARDCA